MVAPARSARRWTRTWLLALALAAIAFAGWESLWRARGFVPSVSDDPKFWAVTRARASNGDPDTVALVGSSRMQLAIDPDAFSAATGWRRPIQLAIPMGPSLPILQDLAADPRFRGTVVCEIDPGITFNKTRSRSLRVVAATHLWAYHGLSPSDRIEERLGALVEAGLVSRLPALGPGPLLRALRRGAWPERNHVFLTRERFAYADFTLVKRQLLRARLLASAPPGVAMRPYPPEEVPGLADAFREAVLRIRERGGRVAFVLLPSSGAKRAEKDEQAPRRLYWDVFRERVGAPSVHFEDHRSLSGYPTPDGTHLDIRQAKRFSRALGRILVAVLASQGNA